MKKKFEPLWEVNKDDTVKALCIFQKLDKTVIPEYLPIDKAKFHWVPRIDPLTRQVIGDDLFIDGGKIELKSPERCYVARGIPPLIYREEDALELRWK